MNLVNDDNCSWLLDLKKRANIQKLSPKKWPFTLFYWDYSIGVLLFSLFIGISVGSFGENGRPLFEDLDKAG